MAEMKRQLEFTHHPIMPLIRCFQKVCDPPAGEYIHWGATTQDIMDTGAMPLKDATRVIVRDLTETHRLLCGVALRYKDTVEAGRTHGQHALPITFGYKVAVWAAEVERHLERIEQMGPRVFQGQFAGAVGTLASIGDHGFELRAPAVCRPKSRGARDCVAHGARHHGRGRLHLRHGDLSTSPRSPTRLSVSSAQKCPKVEEPFHMGKVGSSTMPHKRNPMMSEGVVAVSKLVQMQVIPALQDMVAENERDSSARLDG